MLSEVGGIQVETVHFLKGWWFCFPGSLCGFVFGQDGALLFMLVDHLLGGHLCFRTALWFSRGRCLELVVTRSLFLLLPHAKGGRWWSPKSKFIFFLLFVFSFSFWQKNLKTVKQMCRVLANKLFPDQKKQQFAKFMEKNATMKSFSFPEMSRQELLCTKAKKKNLIWKKKKVTWKERKPFLSTL